MHNAAWEISVKVVRLFENISEKNLLVFVKYLLLLKWQNISAKTLMSTKLLKYPEPIHVRQVLLLSSEL